MRAVPWVVLVITLGAGSACADEEEGPTARVPGADVPVEEVAARYGDAVWRVETEGCGWVGVGSAFAVDEHRLVTNHHVVANDTSPVVRSRAGDATRGRVIGADPVRDIAVIEVDEPLVQTLAWAPTETLQPAERLVVLGYPQPEHAFTTSYGSVVAFGGEVTGREVVLANSPIDRGNSGGPALRGDGSVVGVVTRVVLDDPAQHVAVVYTAAQVAGAVEAAIAAPQDVLSDCGLGPDYTPPLPPGLEVAEPPPPPTPAVTDPDRDLEDLQEELDDVSAPTWVPPAGSGPGGPPPSTEPPLSCPEGTVSTTVVSHTVTTEEDGDRRVDVQGTVVNGTDAAIVVESVEVRIEGDAPVVATALPDQAELAPGESARWEVSAVVPGARDDSPPPTARAAARWRDSLGGCVEPRAAD